MSFIKICFGILIFATLECSSYKNIPMSALISPKIGYLEVFKKNVAIINERKDNIENESDHQIIKRNNDKSKIKIKPKSKNVQKLKTLNTTDKPVELISLTEVPKKRKRNTDLQSGHMVGYFRGPWANAYQRPSVHQFMLSNRAIHYNTRDPEHVRFHTLDEAPAVPYGKPTADQDFIKLHYASRNEDLPSFKPPTQLIPGPLTTFEGDINKPGPHYSFDKTFGNDGKKLIKGHLLNKKGK